MTRVDIENAGRIDREKVIKELQELKKIIARFTREIQSQLKIY